MEENIKQMRRPNPLFKVQASAEACRQLRGRTQGFRHSEVYGLKLHPHLDGATPLPMPRNEAAHLAVSLVQPLRGHRAQPVEPTFRL